MSNVSNTKELIYFERFVNNGSPTKLTFLNSTSTPTSPRHCTVNFKLSFLELEEAIPFFNWNFFFNLNNSKSFLFPIHNDIIPLLNQTLKKRILLAPDLRMNVTPSSSGRTVFCNSINNSFFLKLDYPLILGRFPSEINGQKLEIPLIISKYLQHSNLTDTFFLPEVAGIQAPIYYNNTMAGALIRLLNVHNGKDFLDEKIDLIPAFSIMGKDFLNPSSPSIIEKEISNSDTPTELLWTNYLLPVLSSFWELVKYHGLISESHCQNFFFAKYKNKNIVIWRDFQGFYRDEEFLQDSLKDIGDYHIIKANNPEKYKIRSFLYDWMLGHYYFDELIGAISSRDIDTNSIYRRIIDFTQSSINTNYYFPKEWYSMSLLSPKNKKLNFKRNYKTKFR